MVRRGVALCLFCILLGGGRVLAANCANLQTQVDITMCVGAQLKKADAALNATYRRVMARLDGASAKKRQLVAAERAWIAFRDKECAFAASGVGGGSVYPMVVAECAARLTRERTRALEAYLSCQEGDLACPVPPAG